MIIDSLSRAERYFSMYPGFSQAFNYLRKGVFTTGKHKVDGTNLFAIAEEAKGLGHDCVQLETHRHCIDIQYLIHGHEEIGWRPLEECKHIAQSYSEEKDIAYYSDSALTWIPLLKGHFAIFFPEDAHAPLGGKGDLRRVIVKVPVIMMKKNTEVQFFPKERVPFEKLTEDVSRRFVTSDQVMVANFRLKKGAFIEEHAHPNEQTSYIISGSVKMTIQGKEYVLQSHDIIIIPENVPHAVTALDDTLAIDVFYPPREDFLGNAD